MQFKLQQVCKYLLSVRIKSLALAEMRNIANINTCKLTHETRYNFFECNKPFLNANTVYELAQPNSAVTFSNADARELGKLSNPEDTLTHGEFWPLNFPIYQDATRVGNGIKYSTIVSSDIYQY